VGLANLDSLLNREKMMLPRGQRKTLGVQMTKGLTIGEVTSGSVAAKAGFKSGDKFVSGAGQAIKDMNVLRQIIQAAQGKTKFVVLRHGKEITLYADFGGAKKVTKKAKLY
jgi:S1-C subfamily serine protease